MTADLLFLGTGASGGTPGAGRSERRESSMLVRSDGHRLLLDVTRHFDEQSDQIDHVDAVLNTHAHRDASGGMASLGRWARDRGIGPVPVHAHPEAIATFRSRWSRLHGLTLREVEAGTSLELDPWTATPVAVRHAEDTPTFAWRLDGPTSLVYASDLAQLCDDLRGVSESADVLVVDGAMWGRTLHSHLRIDEALEQLCGWSVGRIIITQIGRSAPPHDELAGAVGQRCERAEPAYDGLVVELG